MISYCLPEPLLEVHWSFCSFCSLFFLCRSWREPIPFKKKANSSLLLVKQQFLHNFNSPWQLFCCRLLLCFYGANTLVYVLLLFYTKCKHILQLFQKRFYFTGGALSSSRCLLSTCRPRLPAWTAFCHFVNQTTKANRLRYFLKATKIYFLSNTISVIIIFYVIICLILHSRNRELGEPARRLFLIRFTCDHVIQGHVSFCDWKFFADLSAKS